MEIQQKPHPTPVMVLKIFAASVSMGAGLAFAFYAGYNSLPYLVPPIIFLELACSPSLNLITRYLRGRLLQRDQLNSLKGCFYMGIVLLCLSIVGSLVFAITGLGHVNGFHYYDYGEYIGLGASLLAVVWSCVLIYDAKYYWKMWERVVGSNSAVPQMFLHP